MNLRITILQTDIVWEDKEANLNKLDQWLRELTGKTDMVILPEMFSTGFSMNCQVLAETNEENTVARLKQAAQHYNTALSGSFIARQGDAFFNRGFCILPNGEEYYYDKRHLFRMGEEAQYFSAGNKQLVLEYKGVHLSLFICYDLRFPVWSRNTDNHYDVLIYPANWPASRRKVWDTLLQARALENMCYVCGVNRTGKDGNGLMHNGGSVIISPKGNIMTSVPDNTEAYATAEINLDELNKFRKKFAVWKDADKFSIV